ncbi:hypothetical protein JTB14_022869 [Gonioctena quinquepunctata]|nr:hypothetical protein JTB14_022869 [Gonioctena quinquepunctata]
MEFGLNRLYDCNEATQSNSALSVTDRPNTSSTPNQENDSSFANILQQKEDLTDAKSTESHDKAYSSTLLDPTGPSTCGVPCHRISPEIIRPHPKAQPRMKSRRRKKGKFSVITDTPEKDELLKADEEKKKIVEKKIRTKKCRKVSKVNKAPEKKRNKKVFKTPEEISYSDSDTQISIHDESPSPQNFEE